MKTDIYEILHNNHTISFAYLFGSYADGTDRQESDVDIAVYMSDTSLDNRLSLHHELEKSLKKNVDLVVLNDIKNIYLLDAILRKGIVVKDNEQRDIFEVQKNHEIIDFKNFRRYIDAA
ncbi:MAG TPA: nucleotidyltransferase domain-containing protein [Campylobacterales bacterium]|nr:nucleotidyltransferase domain-containing protein [Campylobacterales bacterium]